jgi:hypothetical protein
VLEVNGIIGILLYFKIEREEKIVQLVNLIVCCGSKKISFE